MGFKIKEVRMSKGITQTELAKLAGVSRATINNMECGRTTVASSSTLKKLASALNVTIDELFFAESV